MREAGEQLIRELLESKVIEECTSPTPWCSPAFFVKKASGAARLVTDFRTLNKAVDGVGWPFPSSDSIRESILPDSKVFFAIDALSGYFQLPIKKEDRKYLSFITPFGKYMYNRLPMGYSDASDQFLIASDPLVRGIPRVSKSIDDIIGHYQTFNRMATALKKILTRAIDSNFTFSIKKFKIANELASKR